MGLVSFGFLGLVLAAALAQRLVTNSNVRLVVTAATNAAFVASFADAPIQLVPLLAFLLQAWICTAFLRYRPSRTALAVCIAWMVAIFVVLKQYTFVIPVFRPSFDYTMVGLSYVLFRVLHVMIDVAMGERLERMNALRFWTYATHFPCFVTGPIQRYEDFVAQDRSRQRPAFDGDLLFRVGLRTTKGLVKVLLLAPLANHLHGGCIRAAQGAAGIAGSFPTSLQIALAALLFVVYLYWNFSGSIDIVIAAGEAIGFSLPENFNRPFRATNLLDFWGHWHITLSDWLRTYVFAPFVAYLQRVRTDVKLGPYYGVAGFFVTFFIMGAWHGTSDTMILLGIILGTGMSFNKLYQVWARQRLGKIRHRAIIETWWHRRVANGLTISFIASALMLLWLEWGELTRLWDAVSWHGAFLAFPAMVLVVMTFRLIGDHYIKLTLRPRLAAFLASRWTQQSHMALRIIALLIYVALTNSSAPDFVYADF